jgi:phage protein D
VAAPEPHLSIANGSKYPETDIWGEHGLKEDDDFKLKLRKTSYPRREYVVQYQETDFNFISRWLEHEGIFYFVSDGDRCRLPAV